MAEVDPAKEMRLVSTLSELDKMGAAARAGLNADFLNRVKNLKLLTGLVAGATLAPKARMLSPTRSAWPIVMLAALAGGGAGLLQHWSTSASKEEELAKQMLDQGLADRRQWNKRLEKTGFSPLTSSASGTVGRLVTERILKHRPRKAIAPVAGSPNA